MSDSTGGKSQGSFESSVCNGLEGPERVSEKQSSGAWRVNMKDVMGHFGGGEESVTQSCLTL